MGGVPMGCIYFAPLWLQDLAQILIYLNFNGEVLNYCGKQEQIVFGLEIISLETSGLF